MADYLARGDSPLTPAQWAELDRQVAAIAESALVGRRFIDVSGPWGPGMQGIPTDHYSGVGRGSIDMLGETGEAMIRSRERQHLALPILYKDFTVHWRDIETSDQFHTPFDFGPVLQAAADVAHTEDQLIFHGDEGCGYVGLLNVSGRLSLPLTDWGPLGAAFDQIVEATTLLTDRGYFGPYAVVVSPMRYAQLSRVHAQTGVLEIEQIQKLARAGVYRTAILNPNQAVVVSTGAGNLDLVMALDLITAYLGPEKMNHEFRVLEIIAPRIKRPESIFVLEG